MEVMNKFSLTAEHIKLINKFYIREGDCEACPPEVDQKRPWGNSDHLNDLCEILEWGQIYDDEDNYNEALEVKADLMFRELVVALQIVLSCQTFEPGEFEYHSPYSWDTNGPAIRDRGWRRAETNV